MTWTKAPVGITVILGLICGVASSEAKADTVEYQLSGIVSAIDDPLGLLDGWLVVGSPFTSVVEYRDDLIDASADPDIGHFHYEIAGFWIAQSLSVGSLVLNTDPFGLAEIDVRNNVFGIDRFWLSISAVLSNGPAVDQINLYLIDPGMTAFDTPDLPADLDLSAFATRTVDLSVGGGSNSVVMEIQSLVLVSGAPSVPVSSAPTVVVLLMLIALLGYWGLYKRPDAIRVGAGRAI